MPDLNRLSATEALARIRAGTLRAEEYLRACLDRIAERDPHVHAFVCLAADAALACARENDRAATPSVLGGLPISNAVVGAIR